MISWSWLISFGELLSFHSHQIKLIFNLNLIGEWNGMGWLAASFFGGLWPLAAARGSAKEREQPQTTNPPKQSSSSATWIYESCGLWAGGPSAAKKFHSAVILFLLHFILLAFCLSLIKEETSCGREFNERVNDWSELSEMDCLLGGKLITFYSVIKESLLSLWRRQQTKTISPITSIKENQQINFLFHSWSEIGFASRIKKYYNSISRQSGIVHKDKAMRQLDLDLWEMNWLVAAAQQRKAKGNSILLFENGKNGLLCFLFAGVPPKGMNEWNGVVLFVPLVGYGRCPRQGLRQGKANNNNNSIEWFHSCGAKQKWVDWRNQ